MSHAVTYNRHARLLSGYVDSLLKPKQSVADFCRQIGFTSPEAISRWRKAKADPELSTIVRLADSLGMSLGQILVIAEYATSEDLGGAQRPERSEPPSLEEAIAASDLSPESKAAVRRAIIGARMLDRGEADELRL